MNLRDGTPMGEVLERWLDRGREARAREAKPYASDYLRVAAPRGFSGVDCPTCGNGPDWYVCLVGNSYQLRHCDRRASIDGAALATERLGGVQRLLETRWPARAESEGQGADTLQDAAREGVDWASGRDVTVDLIADATLGRPVSFVRLRKEILDRFDVRHHELTPDVVAAIDAEVSSDAWRAVNDSTLVIAPQFWQIANSVNNHPIMVCLTCEAHLGFRRRLSTSLRPDTVRFFCVVCRGQSVIPHADWMMQVGWVQRAEMVRDRFRSPLRTEKR